MHNIINVRELGEAHTIDGQLPLYFTDLKTAYDSCKVENNEPNRIYLPTKSFASLVRALEDINLVERFLDEKPLRFFNAIIEHAPKLDNSKVLAEIVNTDFVKDAKYNCLILNGN